MRVFAASLFVCCIVPGLARWGGGAQQLWVSPQRCSGRSPQARHLLPGTVAHVCRPAVLCQPPSFTQTLRAYLVARNQLQYCDFGCLVRQAGAAVEEVQLPDIQDGVGAIYHLATAQFLKGSCSFEREFKELGCDHVRLPSSVKLSTCFRVAFGPGCV